MRKRRWPRMVATAAVVIVLLLTMAWWFQRDLIYHPDTSKPATPSFATEVTLRTSDDLKLTGWLVEPTDGDRDAAILLTNGNGGNRANRVGAAEALAAKGFTVLLFDYRGYGGNPGSPTETGLYADAEAAHSYLTGEAGFAAERVMFFGESLGAGVASHLAVEHRPAALVLRSPFTSLADAGQSVYPFLPVRLLLSENYPVESNVTRIGVPLLVVYGTGDTQIPPGQSRRVAKAAKDSGAAVTTLAIDGADHNDAALSWGTELVDAVAKLADSAGLAAS